MRTQTLIDGPSNVGHPHRNPDTGLVPEEYARCTTAMMTPEDWDVFGGLEYGDDDPAGHGAFGDGKSIVGATVERMSYGETLVATLVVRPRPSEAPCDPNGRILSGYLAHRLVYADTRERMVTSLVERGLTDTYVRQLLDRSERAQAARAAWARVEAEVDALVAAYSAEDVHRMVDLLADPDLSHRRLTPAVEKLLEFAPHARRERLADLLTRKAGLAARAADL